MPETLRDRFIALWNRTAPTAAANTVSVINPEAIYSELADLYSEPHRAYHNLQHIADCLNQLDAYLRDANTLPQHPDEIEVAIFTHDVIYNPRAHDNEEASARWTAQRLQSAGADSSATERIANLILATKHDATPADPDAQLLVDIDLSILGRDKQAFDAYEQAIRQEYIWAPEILYRAGRKTILEKFLARDRIFQTKQFYSVFENQARINLAASILSLSRST